VYGALTTVKGDLAQTEFGITGRGIVWAIVSTGVDGEHPHFAAHRNLALPEGLHHMDFSKLDSEARRAFRRQAVRATRGEETIDFESMELPIISDLVDPHGQGTAVAGIIAGESTEYRGRLMKGVVPEATILSLNVIDDEGNGDESAVLAALLAVQHMNGSSDSPRIHGVVVPVELGWDVANYACGRSPVCAQMERLVNSGVVAVAVAGNRGFENESNRTQESAISDPGNAELAITVGATHRVAPEVYGPSYFSSRGPTSDGRRARCEQDEPSLSAHLGDCPP
jgi:serine protease AprX